jgi:hypothetical protein
MKQRYWTHKDQLQQAVPEGGKHPQPIPLPPEATLLVPVGLAEASGGPFSVCRSRSALSRHPRKVWSGIVFLHARGLVISLTKV